jgi:hypothetical protein
VGASTVDDAYNGKYIWLRTAPPNTLPANFTQFNDIRLITDYDGATQTATILSTFTDDISAYPAPFLFYYEILNVTDDSFNPITDIYSDHMQQSVCYTIYLESLTLPNVTLTSGDGNRIAFYPYVYVEVNCLDNSRASNLLLSNNPNATRAVFKVPIYNVNSPDRASFVVLNGQGMKQDVKFNPHRGFTFKVILPDGDVFTTTPDTVPPELPDSSLQTSAVISFERYRL